MKTKSLSLQSTHIGVFMARLIAMEFYAVWNFCSLPSQLFHFQNSIGGQTCDFERKKTFTDNICDELRKRLSNLKINPGDQISMWIHHGVRFLFVCKFIIRAGSENIWLSFNLEVNCDVQILLHSTFNKRRRRRRGA